MIRKQSYQRPHVREVGGVQELTLQNLNKVGASPDVLTPATNGVVIGSFVDFN